MDVKIETYRELVCALNAKDVSGRVMCKVEKEVPLDQKAKAAEFTEAAKEIVGETKGVTIKLTCAVGAGDQYDTITKVKKMGEEEDCSIEHKEGQVWLLDFWATWCPPCQKPMAHNQEMLMKDKPEWKDVVRIIGLSIDRDMATLKSHVETKEWTSVEHFWRNESDCSDVYGVRGVPCVMLVDKSGKIVYKGHPAQRNLEEDLDNLAAGKVLEGNGIVNEKPAGGEKKEEKADEDMVPMEDPSAVNSEIDNFKTVFEGFKENEELCNLAKEMPRAFCVLVFTTEYDPKTKKTMGKYENFRVLVGK